jgi:hypothetical protein
MAANSPEIRKKFLELTYALKDDQEWKDAFQSAMDRSKLDKMSLPREIEDDFKSGKNLPQNGEEALHFLKRIPLMDKWKRDPIYQKLFGLLSAEQMKEVPSPSSIWGPQKHLAANVAVASPLRVSPQMKHWIWNEGAAATYTLRPEDFLALTVESLDELRGIQKKAKEKGGIDFFNSDEVHNDMKVHPFLEVYPSGRIRKHEGRHRAASLLMNKEDAYEIALILVDENGRIREGAPMEDVPQELIGQYDSGVSRWVNREKLKPVENPGPQEATTSAEESDEVFLAGLVPTSIPQKKQSLTAGLLDFPRVKLPAEVWLYEDDQPLPRLQPKLRAEILKEARYRLSEFGAKLVGCMLYGGSATYQYHKGGDIDCSLYIDWEKFQGDEELLQDAFKSVEIPWGDYVLHLFVKPSTQQEQVEVADSTYDVLHDRWKLQPLILPQDFDPEIYFKPLIEIAEKKAEEIDILMGKVTREWAILKKALEARVEGPRDPETVDEAIETQKLLVKQEIDKLVAEFAEVWVGRRRMHDAMRKQFVLNREVGRFERFQPAEVTWKYLDQAGYCEFLKLLSKAHEAGTIDELIDAL